MLRLAPPIMIGGEFTSVEVAFSRGQKTQTRD
jgi:hypothetical protein